MATHSSILVWKISRTEEPGGLYNPWGYKELDMTERLNNNNNKGSTWGRLGFELWCWRRLESPLDCKEIQPVHPEGDQSWVFIGKTFWSWNSNTLATWCEKLLIWKDPDAWKIEGRRGRGRQRMRWLDGITDSRDVSLWTPGVGDGQGGLACCDSWGIWTLVYLSTVNWHQSCSKRKSIPVPYFVLE